MTVKMTWLRVGHCPRATQLRTYVPPFGVQVLGVGCPPLLENAAASEKTHGSGGKACRRMTR